MKKVFLSIIFLFITFLLSAQNFNDYKYIIVPKRFDVFKKADQYRSNGLVKFLFEKKGYTVVYDDNLPQDLNANKCLALKVDLISRSNMFTTKTNLILKDCNSNTVYKTQEGKSKEKEYLKAYNEAIRESFKSFNNISYSYLPKKEEKQNNVPIVVSFKDDVKNVEEKPIASTSVEKQEQVGSTHKAEVITEEGVLYAQEIPNGFQLVDSTPKIEYKIYKTTVQGYYIATNNTINGVVINKGDKWFFEYYEETKLISKELKIKF